MFSPLHIILIVLTVLTVPLFSYLSIKQGWVDSIMKGIAIVILFFDPAYWIWEYQTFGQFRMESTLPLYLCSLFWMLMPIAAFSKKGFLKQMSLATIGTVCLISGIMGFVFNYHIDVYPIISFVGIRTLLYHYLMIFVGVLIWVSHYYVVQPGDQVKAFIPVWILLIPGLILNFMYGYDYGYTAGGKGTPFTILSDILPIPIFLVVLYCLFFLIVWFLFYRGLPLFHKRGNID